MSDAANDFDATPPVIASLPAGFTVTDELRLRLYTYDHRLPLDDDLRRRDLDGGLVEERLTFATIRGQRVPGVLVYHRDAPPPRPALLIQHGLGAGKDDERLGLLRSVWARHGFACLSVDAPLHGERAADGPLDVLALLARPFRGLQFVQQTVIDLRRAVDYLAARADVAADRIGYVGFSFSTVLGVPFVAVEPRVRAACFAMGGAGLFHFLVARAPAETRAEQEAVAGLVDPLHYAPLIAPRPVLQVNATGDQVIPPALGHMLHGALREPKRAIWYPGAHGDLPAETAVEMRRFLEEALGVVPPAGAGAEHR
jgi:fermentation-respiration switch protein FrsA (DUF1100 family)